MVNLALCTCGWREGFGGWPILVNRDPNCTQHLFCAECHEAPVGIMGARCEACITNLTKERTTTIGTPEHVERLYAAARDYAKSYDAGSGPLHTLASFAVALEEAAIAFAAIATTDPEQIDPLAPLQAAVNLAEATALKVNTAVAEFASDDIECPTCVGTGRYGFRDDDVCPNCHGGGRVKRIEDDEAKRSAYAGPKMFDGEIAQLEVNSERRGPASARHETTFEEAWAKKKVEGYQYGHAALENVHFGWQIAQEEYQASASSAREELRFIISYLAHNDQDSNHAWMVRRIRAVLAGRDPTTVEPWNEMDGVRKPRQGAFIRIDLTISQAQDIYDLIEASWKNETSTTHWLRTYLYQQIVEKKT